MKTMRHITLLVVLLVGTLAGRAQTANEGIRFVADKTFNEVLAQARQEGKRVFVDCYTTWCGPCKMLATQVFPQKVCGDYFNPAFVSVQIDMEKGEGVELAKRWAISAYPTLLFLSADGTEVHRIVGAESDATVFVEQVKKALEGQTMGEMTARYEGGDRSRTFLSDYLALLLKAYDKQRAPEVMRLLLDGHEEEMVSDPLLYMAFRRYGNDPLTPAFDWAMRHEAALAEKYGQEVHASFMQTTLTQYPFVLAGRNKEGENVLDREGISRFRALLKAWDVAEREDIEQTLDVNVAAMEGNWSEMRRQVERAQKKFGVNDQHLAVWATLIQTGCQQADVRQAAVGWMERRLQQLEEEKARQEPLPAGAVRAYSMVDFTRVYPQLIERMKP